MERFGRHDYDRDLGWRGSQRDTRGGWGGRGEGALRRGGERLESGAGDAFRGRGRGGYDRGLRGYDTSLRTGGRGAFGGGYDRGLGGRGGYGAGRGRTGWPLNDYSRDYANRDRWGAWGTGTGGYDRGLRGYDTGLRTGGRTGPNRGFGAGRGRTGGREPFGGQDLRVPLSFAPGTYRDGMGIAYDRQYKEGIGDEPYYNAADLRGGRGYDRGFGETRRDRWF
jgi:hypothetical protein